MIRLAKLTDYGLVLMTIIARDHATSTHTARDLAAAIAAASADGEQGIEAAFAERTAGFASRHQGRLQLGQGAGGNFRRRNHRCHRRSNRAHRVQYRRYGLVRSGALVPDQAQSAHHQPGGARRAGEGHAFRSDSAHAVDRDQGTRTASWCRRLVHSSGRVQ